VDKIKVSEIREKFPMYGDLNDDQLLIALRRKYYSDIPPSRFYNNIDYDTERDRLNKDLVNSMSTTEKLLAGAGKSFVDLGRSAKRVANMVGIGGYDEAAAKADEALDKPLMDTSAGAWGKGLTDAGLTFVPGLKGAQAITKGVQAGARMLPRAAGVFKGVAPYAGAAGSGAIIGAATTPEDMSGGATTGALAGTAGEAGGRVLSAAYGGAKAAVEPLWQSGRERILKRTFDRFATDPAKVRAAAANPVEYVPGVTPTLAEATMDPGIAQLQRGAASASPDVASALAQARGQQFAGYKGVLDDLAGNDGRMEFFTAARGTAADDLYGQARAAGLAPTREANQLMKDLMQRPSVQQAMTEARKLAREKGIKIDDPAGSVEGLQFVKKALDGQIGAARTSGNTELASALKETQDKLLGYLDMASPMHGEARRTFAAMSRPINQMAIGQKLRDTALPPLTDFSEGSLARVNANSYANALRNADKTARTATGLKGATMEGVMDPAQMAQINGIGQDMARYAGAQELARVPGSPTAQYLGAQNVVRQFLGPLGIPQSAADSMVGRLAAGLMGFPFKMTQSQTEQLLARALTDPKTAARIMSAKDPKTIVEILRPYAAQTAIQMDTQ
jgi:pyruvate/2-oxoglutarate dehydrogenase complex dihydrolipoamide acyltransferase (E2) component